jgi:hypothetical protein
MTTYTQQNFRTKRALRSALVEGQLIPCRDLTPFGEQPIMEGSVSLSGPHYPAAHSWYATGRVHAGYLRSIDGMRAEERRTAELRINAALLERAAALTAKEGN